MVMIFGLLLAGSSQAHTTKKPSPVGHAPAPAPSSKHHHHRDGSTPSPAPHIAPSHQNGNTGQTPAPSQTNAVDLRAVPLVGVAAAVGVLVSSLMMF